MSNPIFTCKRWSRSVGVFQYTANFAEASSGIRVRWPHLDDGEYPWTDDDGWEPVPYQVADAGHDRKRAERLIADYFGPVQN